jgi:TolB-like protein/DNA-binding winged helix-turn-helix (wHTH) protein/Tfp pilus assembly protein PilF
MSAPHLGRVRFGVFEFDSRTGELSKAGRRLPIQGVPIQVLLVLLEHPNQMVAREDLRARIWPADTFVDFDHSLHNAVAKLREALGDKAGSPRFIETLPRRGYRFIASVEYGEVAAIEAPAAKTARRSLGRPTLAAAIVGILALSALILVDVGRVRSRWRGGPSVAPIDSIAVLPLKNLSNDPEQDYLAEGLTETLITHLGKIRALNVISRTSVMQYKNSSKALPEIARELNVGAIVEGTVARSGNRIRITANLVQASPERHLWAETYERDLQDVLRLQSDVARAIVQEIRVALTPQERLQLAGAATVDPELHELYLRGRFFWNRRTRDDLFKSVQYFQRALERDPRYAAAHAGLADAYIAMGYLDFVLPREADGRAKAAALRALEIDESLAEAHTSLAAALQYYDRDWAGAEREFRRAIELNPSYATAHQWYAQLLSQRGRHAESVEESIRAQRLDPLSLIINSSLGNRLYFARKYSQAIDHLQRTLQLDPDFVMAHMDLGRVYEAEGQYGEAITVYARVAKVAADWPAATASLARASARAGRHAEARRMLSELQALASRAYVPPFDVALVHAALGEPDQACARLENAFDDRSNRLAFMAVDPVLDSMRSQPCFQSLLRRMGLEGN